MFVVICALKVLSCNIVVSIHDFVVDIVMVIVFKIRLKLYSCHNVLTKINTLDALTFIQVRTNENNFLHIRKKIK